MSTMSNLALCVFLSASSVAAGGTAELPTATPVVPPRLADVAWIAGHWVGETGGDRSEEVWSAPAGDSMMGMWRWVSGGKAKVFELITLVEDASGVTYRLRHFYPDGVAWEDKDRPLTLPLVRRTDDEAVFEGTTPEGLLRLTYRKRGPDGLAVTLDKGKGGKEFVFKREGTGRPGE